MFKCLHTGDLHFSNTPDKLAEVVRTTDFLLQQAAIERPNVIIVSGDSIDEYDSRIRIDSDCARAAISFIERCGNLAPTVVIRGTKSHDRDAVYLFQHLRSLYPIHVACDVQRVALVPGDVTGIPRFTDLVGDKNYGDIEAVFTLVPSLDKTYIMADDSSGIRSGNQIFKEAVHDLFAGYGIINDQFTAVGIPTFLVTHGMMSGAVFSSGQVAVGEDLEFGLNDLHAACCSYVALGHVHKYQEFPGNVFYCGSPGRLNFGETEDKGFIVAEFLGKHLESTRFVTTPARRFCFGEVTEYVGAEDVYAQAQALAIDCRGADVRFRLSIPQENRADIDRDRLEQLFLVACANKVKIEISVIPKQRARAEGISHIDSLAEKVLRWGATVGEAIPDNVPALASIIEGVSAEELLMQAQVAAAPAPVVPVPTVAALHVIGVKVACDRYLESQGGQAGLFT